MTQAQAEPVRLAPADTQAPQGLELRHLRYLAAVADAGTFTRAVEQLFIAQPTLISLPCTDAGTTRLDGDPRPAGPRHP